jgi:hypothetical protein
MVALPQFGRADEVPAKLTNFLTYAVPEVLNCMPAWNEKPQQVAAK